MAEIHKTKNDTKVYFHINTEERDLMKSRKLGWLASVALAGPFADWVITAQDEAQAKSYEAAMNIVGIVFLQAEEPAITTKK